MAQKSGTGLFALLAGMAAGAAAVFFSSKENRTKAAVAVKKAEKSIEKVGAEAKKNPKKFAKKVVKKANVTVAKVEKKAAKIEKQIQQSPVLKAVGKKS